MMKFFKRFKDLAIEGAQARVYNELTRTQRMQEIREQAKEAAMLIKEGDRVLEIAAGAGYLSIELAKLGHYRITGVDISSDLATISRRNAVEAGVNVNFQQGNAANLPFAPDSFDFVICVLAFKNFKMPLRAMKEMYRVIKPGGTALIIDLNRKASLQATKAVAEKMGLKGWKAVLADLIQRSGAYSRKDFESFISKTNFSFFNIKDSEIGFSIYLTK